MTGGRRRVIDDNSTFTSAGSTLSSYSGSGSTLSGSGASTWSLPRSRAIPATRREGGPRRHGSSFRVSLRPTRHRSARIGDVDNEEPRHFPFTMRRTICLFAVVVVIITTIRASRSSSASVMYSFRDTNDKLSTEDLVAQGELSAKADEMLGDRDLPFPIQDELVNDEQHKKEQAFVEFVNKDTTAALRGSSLVIEDKDEKSALLDEMNSTDESINATTPQRLNWGPALQESKNDKNHSTVAYVLPIFSCYKLSGQGLNHYGLNEPGNDREFQDASLMLQASVHKNSVRNPNSGSSYDYQMVALVHRGVESCAGGTNRTVLLQRIGYRVEVVREPIHASNIKNTFLQQHAPRNNGGRAGMREMIRLYAFKMIEYPITVLVEPTTWILHPPDAIFDTLLNGPRGHEWAESHPSHIVRDTFYPNGTISTTDKLPIDLDIMFSRDYSSMSVNSWTTGISLAFVPIRPSQALYNRLVNVYQSTNYDPKYGWESKGYVHYAGSMQTKGLLTYFFSEIAPHRKLELHRCIYNNLADVPFIAGKKGGSDSCRDVKEHRTLPDGSIMPCTDCRIQVYDEIVVANFAICQSPWFCPYIEEGVGVALLVPTLKMCRRFHSSWFTLRKVVEDVIVEESKRVKTTGTFHPEIFHGYCQPGGVRGGAYVTMDYTLQLPEGIGSVPLT